MRDADGRLLPANKLVKRLAIHCLVLDQFGRYAFPGIVPLALLVVGSLHAFGRRHMLIAGAVLASFMIALSVASQLLVLTKFYA